MSGHMEKEEIKIDQKEKEEAKKNCRFVFSISQEYEIWEVLDAIIDGGERLEEIKTRSTQLRDCYNKFCDDVDSKDDAICRYALENVQRPAKGDQHVT